MDRRFRRGPERAEQRQHLFLLDQPPRRFNALRSAVGVVQGEELDLAAVDAALFVQHLEISFADTAEHTVQRTRTPWPHRPPALAFCTAPPRLYFFLALP